MIAFDAEVLEAADNGRLHIRLPTGPAFRVRASSAGIPAALGDRGMATLPAGPAGRWPFVASY